MNELEPQELKFREWEMSCSSCGRHTRHRANFSDCIELKGRTRFEGSNSHLLPKKVEVLSEEGWQPHPVVWLLDTEDAFCTVWVTDGNVLISDGNPDWELLIKAKEACLLTSTIED